MYSISYILILGGYVSTNQTTSYVGEMLSSMQVLLLKEGSTSTYLTTNNSHEYFSSELTRMLYNQCKLISDIPLYLCNYQLYHSFTYVLMKFEVYVVKLATKSDILESWNLKNICDV